MRKPLYQLGNLCGSTSTPVDPHVPHANVQCQAWGLRMGARARRKRPRTTVPGPPGQERPSELLGRDFTAPAPNGRQVADSTYVETAAGFVYAAFILDLFPE